MTGTIPAALERWNERPVSMPGALLLVGTSEPRLEVQARRLAARALCPGPDPSGSCAACRRVQEGVHPDLFVVEPEGVQIRIDRVREALAFGAGRPYEAPRRVAIVSRADLLGLEASNALLKSLEEPGRDLRWILTTSRPETLLPTIRSRCAVVTVPAPSRSDRRREWTERGFSPEDAADLALSADETHDGAAAGLEEYRALRERITAALAAGLCRGDLSAIVLLAEELSRAEAPVTRLAAELLADAALGPDAPADAVRHPAVAAEVRRVAACVPGEALRRATLKAIDSPADTRKGNKRLHWEALLLELYAERLRA